MSVKNQVTPYADAEVSKKGQVTRMFDKIAPYYDNLNRVLSLGIDVLWRKKAINLLKKENPKTILDIATGTADLAIEAARTIKPDQIIGMDISVNMLKIGEEKINKKGLSDVIKLEAGDSENLQYDSDSFDAVMAAFGVRNFENLEKGLAEMFRVLKPGGTMMVLEFSKPTGGLAVWAKFDKSLPLPEIARKSRENGLWISDGLHYSSKLNATRLGFAAVNEQEIEQGMAILKKSILGF